MLNTRRFVSLLTVAMLAAMAFLTPAARANDRDKIWETSAQQGATSMKAKYVESPENGALEQDVEVQIEDAIPNTTYVVTIDGKRIGRITTNGIGDGRLVVHRFPVQPGPDGRPVGPRVEEGSVLTVKTRGQSLSGTFVRTQ